MGGEGRGGPLPCPQHPEGGRCDPLLPWSCDSIWWEARGDRWIYPGLAGCWWPVCVSRQAPRWESTPSPGISALGGAPAVTVLQHGPAQADPAESSWALLGPLEMWGLFQSPNDWGALWHLKQGGQGCSEWDSRAAAAAPPWASTPPAFPRPLPTSGLTPSPTPPQVPQQWFSCSDLRVPSSLPSSLLPRT